MKRWWQVLAFLGLLAARPAPISAQQSDIADVCRIAGVPAEARDYCLLVAQTLASAQPQLGILVAGGNPTPGTASTRGLRLGMLPGVSASGKLNLVFARLPDILAERGGAAAGQLNRTVDIRAPALQTTIAVGAFPGVDFVPGIGGIGSVDLLGSASWLPLRLAGVRGVGDETSSVAWGGGVRVGLIRESFIAPGVSASLMYRRLGWLEYGDVCPSSGSHSSSGSFEIGSCPAGGDAGEFAFDLTNWSGRFAAGKRLLGVGLTGGLGYDRFASDVGFGFRGPPASGAEDYFARLGAEQLRTGRWSAFVNGSFTALVATMAVEGGWLAGGDPLPGFTATESAFDPRSGTFFGSIGARLAF